MMRLLALLLSGILVFSPVGTGVKIEINPMNIENVSGGQKTMTFKGCPGDPMNGYITVTNTGEIGLGGRVSVGSGGAEAGYVSDCSWLTVSQYSFGLAPGQTAKLDLGIDTSNFKICKAYSCKITINITFENGTTDTLIYDIAVIMNPPMVSCATPIIDLGAICPSKTSGRGEYSLRLILNNTGCEYNGSLTEKGNNLGGINQELSVPARTMNYPVKLNLNLNLYGEPGKIFESDIMISDACSNRATSRTLSLLCKIRYRLNMPPEFITEPVKLKLKGGESETVEIRFRDKDNDKLRLVVRPPFRSSGGTSTSALVTISTTIDDIGKIIKSELELTDFCYTVRLPIEVEVVDSLYPPFVTEPVEFDPIILVPGGTIEIPITIVPISEPPLEVKEDYDKPIIVIGEPQIDVVIKIEKNKITVTAKPNARRGCDIAIIKITVGDRETVKLLSITIKGGK
ncbi:MAG: hypothetical protein KAH30_03105 [Caldisericia bacterium]|nr:hypothetical protein [Caldisericia bacterium]